MAIHKKEFVTVFNTIIEQFALRFSASTTDYIDNPLLGLEDWNTSTKNGLRAVYLNYINDRLTVKANYTYQDGELDSGRNLVTSPDLSNPTVLLFHVVPFEDEISIYNFTFEYEADWAAQYSSTTYYNR